MTEEGEQSSTSTPEPTERERAMVREFVSTHGKPIKAVVENLGRMGARVVLIGPDGRIGDVIVSGTEVGKALVAAEEEAELADWDAETVNQTTVGSGRRRRMGLSLTRR